LLKSSYEDVTKAINGARDALIEKTRVMAIEAEFADRQAEIVKLQREQITAVDKIASAQEKLNSLGHDAAQMTEDQLRALYRANVSYSSFGTQITSTGKAALELLGVRRSEEAIAQKIAERQSEINEFTNRYGEELSTASEATENIQQNTQATADSTAAVAENTEKAKNNWIEFQKTMTDSEGQEQTVTVGMKITDWSEEAAKQRDEYAASQEQIRGVGNAIEEAKNKQLEMVQAVIATNASLGEGVTQADVFGTKLLDNLGGVRGLGMAISDNVVGGLQDALWAADSLGSALKNIGKQLAQMATSALFRTGINAVLGIGSGGALTGAGLFGSVFGLKQGGEISISGGVPTLKPIKAAQGLNAMVPGGFPNDSYPVMLNLTSGEKVTVQNQQQQAAAGSASVNVNNSFQVLDPIGFERWAKTSGRSAFKELFRDIEMRGR